MQPSQKDLVERAFRNLNSSFEEIFGNPCVAPKSELSRAGKINIQQLPQLSINPTCQL